MPTSPTPITALPTPPSRTDPANFPARADAFVAQMPTFGTQANALATNVYNNAVEADQDATAAAASQAAAAASQASAASSAASASTNAATATTKAAEAAASAAAANTSAGNAAGSAASALAIYGSTAAQQAAVTSAQNFASQAAASAASASSVVQQDLSGINAAALHRSPNAVTALFIYDTSKDSDGGAWTERCQHTSWYNEDINGAWRGAIGGASLAAAETTARAISGAATGDYFQYSGDGKFYRLNAGSGTTEVFRGNKRDFPRLAGIVAEAGNVTIYDLTESGRPMWMRFVGVAYQRMLASDGATVISLHAMNAVLAIGEGGGSTYGGIILVNFVRDGATRRRETNPATNPTAGNFRGTIAQRNASIMYDMTPLGAVGSVVYAIAMAVLPDAPTDSVSGLPIPTIALGTNSAVRVVNPDGTIAQIGTANVQVGVSFVGTSLYVEGVVGTSYQSWIADDVRKGASAVVTTRDWGRMSNAGGKPGYSAVSKTRALAAHKETPLGFVQGRFNREVKARDVFAHIANTYNTGYMLGEWYVANPQTRRVFLSDVGAGSATGTVADRSYKAASATITGTLTKTEVASAAQLVAYSGWSAANYAREAYSADLDFGTGDWSVGAWINIPASALTAEYPVYGTDLLAGAGAFTSSAGWSGLSANCTISGGSLTKTGTTTHYVSYPLPSLSLGDVVIVKFDVVALNNPIGIRIGHAPGWNQSAAFVTTTGTQYRVFTAFYVASGNVVGFDFGGSITGTIQNLTVFRVRPSTIVSRAHSSGAYFELTSLGPDFLQAVVSDGTTTRTVVAPPFTGTAVNPVLPKGVWLKAEAFYRAGRLSLNVNGVEVASTAGAPLLTLNNSNAVLTIGNNNALDAPFPGSIALLKLSATVPSPDQALWMYEQEKQLFRAGAQCCLPDSGNIVDLSYDEATDRWVAVSAANESYWSGLVRASSAAVPAGSFTKIAARAGIELAARSTTTPGVDVTIPAYGLREELVNRAEAAARLSRDTVIFDYVGGFTANTTNGSAVLASVANLSVPASTTAVGAQVTGSGIPASTTLVTTTHLSAAATATAAGVQINFTDFILPVGYEARAVLVAGAIKQEGATKDFTRLFDGFRETIRFGTAPGNTAWVQIQAVRVPQ